MGSGGALKEINFVKGGFILGDDFFFRLKILDVQDKVMKDYNWI